MLSGFRILRQTHDYGKPADKKCRLPIQAQRRPKSSLGWEDCYDACRLQSGAFRRPISHSLIARDYEGALSKSEVRQPIYVCLTDRIRLERSFDLDVFRQPQLAESVRNSTRDVFVEPDQGHAASRCSNSAACRTASWEIKYQSAAASTPSLSATDANLAVGAAASPSTTTGRPKASRGSIRTSGKSCG